MPGLIRIPAWLFIPCLLGTFAWALQLRWNQVEAWKAHPADYFSGDIPMMTTADGYYWLRMAEKHRNGTFLDGGDDPLRGFPGPPGLNSRSLLPRMIGGFAKLTGWNVHRAGFYLSIVLAVSFVIPWGLCLQRAGHPIAGLVGGLIATVSSEYFIRTGAGRVDTDLLNVFFFSSIALTTMWSVHSRTWVVLFWTIVAGVLTQIFKAWYEHYFFFSAVFGSLVIYQIAQRVRWQVVAASIIVFLVPTNGPLMIRAGAESTIILFRQHILQEPVVSQTPESGANQVGPNLATTITENERLGWREGLTLTVQNERLALAGFAACLLLFAVRWRSLLPLAPLAGMGILTLISQRRFAIYLAPLVGTGIGVIVCVAVSLLWGAVAKILVRKNGSACIRPPAWVASLVLILAAAVAFHFVLPYTMAKQVPQPKITPRAFEELRKLRGMLPENAKLWNFWNLGYLLQDVVGRQTFTDGGAQSAPRSYFMARSYGTASPEEFYRIVSFVTHVGEIEIEKRLAALKGDYLELIKRALADDAPLGREDIFVIFTENMLSQFPAIYDLGSWDFYSGAKTANIYGLLNCQRRLAVRMFCTQGVIDVEKGTVGDKPLIGHVLYIRDGKIVKRQATGQEGYVLEIVLEDASTLKTAMVVKRPAYYSNFNQMYVLGNYDKRFFEEVYNAFPYVRVFKVKTAPTLMPERNPATIPASVPQEPL